MKSEFLKEHKTESSFFLFQGKVENMDVHLNKAWFPEILLDNLSNLKSKLQYIDGNNFQHYPEW